MLSQHPYRHHEFVMAKLGNLSHKIVLDIGCGKGVIGFLIKTEQKDLAYLIGIDLNLEYLRQTKLHNVYDDLILASAETLPFKNKSIDVVIAVEVIEHLSKTKGYVFLEEIEKIVLNLALLTTPNGFLESKTPSNLFEVHRSGWQTEELRSKSFQIFGMGLKLYRNHPSTLTYVLQYILTPFTWIMPQISAFLLALKKYESKGGDIDRTKS
jgi:ubiquinone/menaquinone biosynthesis C-methylase UbiE